ncbi:MAG: hypothetical protein QNJ30_17000 [Kiloniellales bacterium]|nr:hypothetical protein [Kiloniellales bacterium]
MSGHSRDDGRLPDGSPPGGGGTLAMAGDLSSLGETLTDEEMSEMRGGLNGFAFSFALAAYSDIQGLTGLTAVAFDSTGLGLVSAPNLQDLGGGVSQVEMTTSVGSFGSFNGILQTANVMGNFNVVNQYLDMQINIFNLGAGANIQIQNIPMLSGL